MSMDSPTAPAPILVAWIALLTALPTLCAPQNMESHNYCIVGAGPAGLQMSYFLQKAGRDYATFEREQGPGSFFHTYPRHRTLVSINKRYTGRESDSPEGKDYNLRHDWHSLLSDDDNLQMRHFSNKFFPTADEYLAYLEAFVNRTSVAVRYGHEVMRISDVNLDTPDISYELAVRQVGGAGMSRHRCAHLILATGMQRENVPDVPGIELTESYGTYDLDPKRFANKTVAVIGAGNSAFEIAKGAMGEAAYVHLFGRTKRMAWETHYGGDLRSGNAVPLDNYQLLAQDVYFYQPFEFERGEIEIRREVNGGRRQLCMRRPGHDEMVEYAESEMGLDYEAGSNHSLTLRDRTQSAFDHCYDHIVRATGFALDASIFGGLRRGPPKTMFGRNEKKYPQTTSFFESPTNENMYFLGANAHGVDYKRSSGGFIRGFRYNARVLFNLLEEVHHGVPWPNQMYTLGDDLLREVVRRIDSSSALYHMYGTLCDVILIRSREGEGVVEYLYEVPQFEASMFAVAPIPGDPDFEYLTITLEYGPEFYGDKRVWAPRFIADDPALAYRSQFLHPVIRYWNPAAGEVYTAGTREQSPTLRATAEHHVLESLTTNWRVPELHVRPLSKFFRRIRDGPVASPDPEKDVGWWESDKSASQYVEGSDYSETTANVETTYEGDTMSPGSVGSDTYGYNQYSEETDTYGPQGVLY